MKYTRATLAALSSALALLISAPMARAADQVVTNAGDNGSAGQLRAKLTAAQSSGGGIVTFDIGTATITLASTLPNITASVTIDGGSNVTISGAGGVRPFVIDSGGTLKLQNLVVERGYFNGEGGAILNSGKLTLHTVTMQTSYAPLGGGAIATTGAVNITNCTFASNISSNGAAINASATAPVTITGSMFHDNSVSAAGDALGGAIYTSGPLTITDSEFASNQAEAGGAIHVLSATAVTSIKGSTFHDNKTTGMYPNANGAALLVGADAPVTITTSTFRNNLGQSGGAIYVLPSGQLTMTESTLNNNSSTNGGAIYNKGTVTLTNVTIFGNSASHGGGIDNFKTSVVTNTTFADNSGTYGYSIKNENATSIVTLSNTIFTTNAPGAANFFNFSGTIVSHGHNLSNDAAGGDASTGPGGFLNGTGDLRNTDPMLDTMNLQSNGGPTETIGLLANSPVINAADPAFAPAKDQRGYARVGAPDIGAFEFGGTIPVTLGNISTRAFVQTGDNVLIGGFIITGTHAKKVLLRAIGPSLPVPGKLANPKLELHGGGGAAIVVSNDNWQSAANHQEIMDTGIAPTNPLESAILMSLAPGSYTAIVRGVNNGTGVALIEAYDLDRTTDSVLGNISTRSLVQTGDNVMIGGFIVVGTDPQKVIVRAIGPSLPVTGKLANPTLELHDSNGVLLVANDNWKTTQQAEIEATGIPPTNDLESAIVRTLTPGNYTAIVRGKNNTTGVALVEVYGLN